MRVLIADGHDVVRRGLKEVLVDVFPKAVVSEARNGDQTLKQLAEVDCDLLLLDINMPGERGLEVLRGAKCNYSQMPVIVVSMNPEEQYANPCLRVGAAAYIKKDRASDELTEALKTIVGPPIDRSSREPV
jgi:DNA-binding NarL/FixJ family response regulator